MTRTLSISEAIDLIPDVGINGVDSHTDDLLRELTEAEEDEMSAEDLAKIKIKIVRRALLGMVRRALWELEPVTIRGDSEDDD
jgi:hypothetical protein